jgi:hypothetical protein
MASISEVIKALENANLNRNVFGDGRDDQTTNEEYWNKLQVGDKVYPTVWFLRDFYYPEKAIDAAINGLIIIDKMETSYTTKIAMKISNMQRSLRFENISITMDFDRSIAQQIWKVESLRLLKIRKLKNG